MSTDAVGLIQRIWNFLKSDAQSKLEAAQLACEVTAERLKNIDLKYFESNSGIRRLLDADLPTIVPQLESQVGAFAARLEQMIESLKTHQCSLAPPLIRLSLIEIVQFIESHKVEISSLENDDSNAQLNMVENELRQYDHRRILGTHLESIESYVKCQKWIKRAQQSIGSTRHITMKYNDLFRELVTERYTKQFNLILTRLNANAKVTVETHGQKGETVREIVLIPTGFPNPFPVDKILSDGEKKAAALADFLTEVMLDEHSDGIILDDPASSLDNDSKKVLAEYLVGLTSKGQVIVFTHDLAFLYMITSQAEKSHTTILSHWIRVEDGRPGFVYPGNSPVCEEDYESSKIASSYYSKAKTLPPNEQQSVLQLGFGALRTSYEVLVMSKVFNKVVVRFEERVSFDRLKEVHFSRPLADEIVERMSVLSRYFEGHSHSDAYAGEKPTPATLLAEIEAFEDIRRRQKEFNKDREAPAPPVKHNPNGPASIND